jgi:hypothetical protein
MSRTYPPVPGRADGSGYIAVADSSRSQKHGNSCCPICKAITLGVSGKMAKVGEYIRYGCGGTYRASVDRDGNPAWIGACGAGLVQTELFGGKNEAEDQSAGH